ncbi:MAG: tetratricopeptide repeat protein [Algicola sp.]|nr:tetratricopeptide repeat protein [Algicola sp.]
MKQDLIKNSSTTKHLALLVALFFAVFNIQAQNDSIDKAFQQKTAVLIAKKSPYYQFLDSVLRHQDKNDSVKMAYLLKKTTENKYLEGESFAYNMLGIIDRNLSKYNRSTERHLKAVALAKQANNIELEVFGLNMLGVTCRRQDLIRQALDYHKEALDLAENAKTPSKTLKQSIAVSQNSMGNIYLALKQYDFAIEQFKKSLKIEIALNNNLGLAINHHNIGYAQEAKGQIDLALENYKTSLKHNNIINSEIGRIICYNSIAKIDIKKGQYKKALSLVTAALEKAKVEKDQFYLATSHLNLGLTLLKMGQLDSAESNLYEALNISKTYHLKSSKSTAYNYLSEVYELKKDYQTALKYKKLYQDLEASITNERNIQYVNGLIITYETEKKNNQIQALANENEIVKLKLKQHKNFQLLGSLGGLLLIIILVILYRQHKLKNEKKIITLEQEMLRNQMNPHFIFNSLNSIKLYIINNEKENAVYYLNKFSKLIRKILVASTEKDISLEEELETMGLYMNIENIRLSNEIEYAVFVDKHINTSTIKVPSLILQPFLENALWHGLSSKKGDKKITLNITKNSPEHITITITDNGIGRAASQKIKSQKKLKRKSVGIAITKARLSNFSKAYTSDYKIDIEDLFENGTPSGTRVVVNIPIRATALKSA